MSRTRAAPAKSTKPAPAQPTKPSATGRSIGMDRSPKWRCNACTFLSEGDTCETCGAPKSGPPPLPHAAKPVTLQARGPREEVKSEVYFDPVDGSMNVPIAGIKKYYPRPDENPRVPKAAVPKLPGNVMTISDLEEEAQHPQRQPPKQHTKDLIGMLQDADHSDTLPMMRHKGKKAGKKK